MHINSSHFTKKQKFNLNGIELGFNIVHPCLNKFAPTFYFIRIIKFLQLFISFKSIFQKIFIIFSLHNPLLYFHCYTLIKIIKDEEEERGVPFSPWSTSYRALRQLWKLLGRSLLRIQL